MAEGGGGEKTPLNNNLLHNQSSSDEEQPKREEDDEPESQTESVKLFVGQVPKHMTESQLLSFFRDFALVRQVNIIRDKLTLASRGTLLLFSIPFPLSLLDPFLIHVLLQDAVLQYAHLERRLTRRSMHVTTSLPYLGCVPLSRSGSLSCFYAN